MTIPRSLQGSLVVEKEDGLDNEATPNVSTKIRSIEKASAASVVQYHGNYDGHSIFNDRSSDGSGSARDRVSSHLLNKASPIILTSSPPRPYAQQYPSPLVQTNVHVNPRVVKFQTMTEALQAHKAKRRGHENETLLQQTQEQKQIKHQKPRDHYSGKGVNRVSDGEYGSYADIGESDCRPLRSRTNRSTSKDEQAPKVSTIPVAIAATAPEEETKNRLINNNSPAHLAESKRINNNWMDQYQDYCMTNGYDGNTHKSASLYPLSSSSSSSPPPLFRAGSSDIASHNSHGRDMADVNDVQEDHNEGQGFISWTDHFIALHSTYRDRLALLHFRLCAEVHQLLLLHRHAIRHLQTQILRTVGELEPLLSDTIHNKMLPEMARDLKDQQSCCQAVGKVIRRELRHGMLTISSVESDFTGIYLPEDDGGFFEKEKRKEKEENEEDVEWTLFGWSESQKPFESWRDVSIARQKLHNIESKEKQPLEIQSYNKDDESVRRRKYFGTGGNTSDADIDIIATVAMVPVKDLHDQDGNTNDSALVLREHSCHGHNPTRSFNHSSRDDYHKYVSQISNKCSNSNSTSINSPLLRPSCISRLQPEPISASSLVDTESCKCARSTVLSTSLLDVHVNTSTTRPRTRRGGQFWPISYTPIESHPPAATNITISTTPCRHSIHGKNDCSKSSRRSSQEIHSTRSCSYSIRQKHLKNHSNRKRRIGPSGNGGALRTRMTDSVRNFYQGGTHFHYATAPCCVHWHSVHHSHHHRSCIRTSSPGKDRSAERDYHRHRCGQSYQEDHNDEDSSSSEVDEKDRNMSHDPSTSMQGCCLRYSIPTHGGDRYLDKNDERVYTGLMTSRCRDGNREDPTSAKLQNDDIFYYNIADTDMGVSSGCRGNGDTPHNGNGDTPHNGNGDTSHNGKGKAEVLDIPSSSKAGNNRVHISRNKPCTRPCPGTRIQIQTQSVTQRHNNLPSRSSTCSTSSSQDVSSLSLISLPSITQDSDSVGIRGRSVVVIDLADWAKVYKSQLLRERWDVQEQELEQEEAQAQVLANKNTTSLLMSSSSSSKKQNQSRRGNHKKETDEDSYPPDQKWIREMHVQESTLLLEGHREEAKALRRARRVKMALKTASVYHLLDNIYQTQCLPHNHNRHFYRSCVVGLQKS
ncbi:hypothetical protein BCR41DRAFT_397151 [Lobosporangium transversale]|uniref:Uncharacterized protein n=1 Tax=Lobosporangium transversale TaxID=64571 RepID=A0A1Y2GK03_9FUNG|nr:hypothetical protein BCR41DRAFT_397151 [Lobosporangium transversale]ORZ13338.1 hypothetical protein BCR41DRAFT_397151 [Lobosporangium transversale]|eukprot:XP_021880419.1 hypothetical protein BCR41DRAFT_397151 [Lobosporangium transversale]